MTAAEAQRLGRGLGLDALGIARAGPYLDTERHIRERRARGLFGRMRFTMARPDVSCHPERLLPGARTVVSAALCYWVPEPERPAGHGRLPRYTWRDRYAELRRRLDALGRAIGGDYRVLVDENDHVDREAAARSGVGFYGKNTMLITRRHGSWVVLGTLVTTSELEPTPPLGAGCGSCTRCIDACPTGALDEPGVLDATRCLSYWTQAPEPIPAAYRPHLGAQVYGCDICQDVCPWNRGVERRLADEAPDPDAHVDLVAWLEADGGELVGRFDRLYVPRNDPRWLRRNALVALGNVGAADGPARAVLERYAAGEDELLAEHAASALARLEETVELNILERRIARVRLIAVPFAMFQVAVTTNYPSGYAALAWLTTAVFTVGGIGFVVWARVDLVGRPALIRSVIALGFDFVVLSAYALAYSWEPGTPTRQLLFFPMLEGCFRFAVLGGVVMALLTAPVALACEKLRTNRFGGSFRWDFVTFQVGFEILIALVVGWIVGQLGVEYAKAQARAAEAEELRDELGRRADLLDAVNRCARALSSSLVLSEAFGAFLRELRRLLPFDRVAIVLAEDGMAEVMAAAGAGSRRIFPTGSATPIAGTLLEDVLAGSQPVYRRTLDGARYREEAEFLELGMGCRLAAPLVAGTHTIGMLSLVRTEPDAFEAQEIELLALLGRLVATAVQNIHAYEAERRTVDELRNLSTLRADFVSLVSHELRSPMAAVIGSARTLQRRWRELSPEHRDSFLALIADETDRLAMLVGDVLDTSRIEAGTFGYAFGDVDMGALVEEAVASASAGQDAIEVVSSVPASLPTVRGDADRLRQVLANLIDNAVKYSPDGERVEVLATATDGNVRVDVSDHGSGIPPGHRRQIFEKFHRVHGPNAKPGTGLGLYIARSIVEAHGGSIGVDFDPGRGSTFTVALPAG